MRDYADGTIEMTILSGFSLPLYCLARAVSYWLSSGISIIFVSIPVGLVWDLTRRKRLFVHLPNFATATISLVGTSISALTAGLRGGSLFLITLLLPLLPPVIFGTSATSNTAIGLNPTAELFPLWILHTVSESSPYRNCHGNRSEINDFRLISSFLSLNSLTFLPKGEKLASSNYNHSCLYRHFSWSFWAPPTTSKETRLELFMCMCPARGCRYSCTFIWYYSSCCFSLKIKVRKRA